jgi:phosphatidylglycerophosphatase A
MSAQETSDNLIPPTTEPAKAKPRTLTDFLALAFATWGVGYLPIAPGTWGSLVGVGIFIQLQVLRIRFYNTYGDGHWVPFEVLSIWTMFVILVLIVICLLGIWSGTRVEKLSGKKDAGIVVVDEVAGQLITLFVLPNYVSLEWPLLLTGFLLFRAFDIWKPFPARTLEKLEGGLGVMADDVVAGFYAAALLSIAVVIRSTF